MEKRSTLNGEFPEDGEYVLGYVKKDNWHDCPLGNHYWKVVRFERGISMKERESMDDSNPKKNSFSSADEFSNNKVPWRWNTFGSSCYFGQEIETWYALGDLER